MSMQLLLATAINCNTFNILQSILRTISESYTGQLSAVFAPYAMVEC